MRHLTDRAYGLSSCMSLARARPVKGALSENSLRQGRPDSRIAHCGNVLSRPRCLRLPREVRFANGFALEQDRVVPEPPPDLGACRRTTARRELLRCAVCRPAPPYLAGGICAARRPKHSAICPRYAVVVKARHDRIAELESLAFVSWIAPFQPVCKLERAVLEARRPGPLACSSVSGTQRRFAGRCHRPAGSVGD